MQYPQHTTTAISDAKETAHARAVSTCPQITTVGRRSPEAEQENASVVVGVNHKRLPEVSRPSSRRRPLSTVHSVQRADLRTQNIGWSPGARVGASTSAGTGALSVRASRRPSQFRSHVLPTTSEEIYQLDPENITAPTKPPPGPPYDPLEWCYEEVRNLLAAETCAANAAADTQLAALYAAYDIDEHTDFDTSAGSATTVKESDKAVTPLAAPICL